MSEPVFIEDEKLYYNDDVADVREIIGATSQSMGEDEGIVNWHITLSDGETLSYSNERGADDIIAALSDLPPAAQLPELELPESTLTGTFDSTVEFTPWKSDEPEEEKLLGPEPIDPPVKNAQWKDADDVSNTIAVRSSNYGLYEDQAAVEADIKAAFERMPNWSKLKPDARCALDMIATKVSRIGTGKPDLHDSWHDIQGYAKLVADRIKRHIEAMGGTL